MTYTIVPNAALMSLFAIALAIPLQAGELPLSQSTQAAAYNITLVTDAAPDFTDIPSYLQSITSQFKTPQEKAIAVWRWSQRLRKQTSCPTEGGDYVMDPILFFTNSGYTNCGIISGIDNALWLNLGWKAHYVQLGDHTVSECSWDGGKSWHMFDNSMSFYCFNDQGHVAGVREIEKTPRFYLENFAPECGSNPSKGLNDHQAWRVGADRPVQYQRTLANGVDSFLSPNDVYEDHLAARWGRRYVLNLRPAEHYTRYFKNLDAAKPDPRYYRPLHGKDVEVASGDKNIRGNGVWRYAPNLRDPATQKHVYSDSGVTWTTDGVKGPGSVTFKVAATNIVTSAKLLLRAVGATVSVSRDAGIRWLPISASAGELQLLDEVAGVTEYLVKVDLSGPTPLLSSLVIETITQLNRPSLPKLVRGPNQVRLRLGPQVDTITLAPPIVGGDHKKTVCDEKFVDVNPKPYFNVPTLRAGAKGEPCFATWKIESPTPIVDVTYGGNVCVNSSKGSVSLFHSWDGKSFSQDFRKADGALPYDQVANVSIERSPKDAQAVYLRYRFDQAKDAELWSFSGIQTAYMAVHHETRTTQWTPIEVTYCWVEHRESGDLERKHTELVTSSAHQYTINVGGYRDPTMRWVRMNLQRQRPDQDKVKYGYSDGQNVGPGAKAVWERYLWGKNLALGKPYQLDGKQDSANPDSGKDLTDGIIAPPDTYVSQKWMPTNVMFARDAAPVVTIDLGQSETVAAVRVHAGQSGNDFRVTYPEKIVVETSSGGKLFAPAGVANFNQVFTPPADFVPWECDDSAEFQNLPAGGRLAYAFRILMEKPISARYVRVTCTSRKSWGTLLSEVQVFDIVTVEKDVSPLVTLPRIQSGNKLP